MVLSNKKALIVEDDAHSLLTLGSLLDGVGIEYKRNTTGSSVLEQARRLQPDVILLDLSLPDGDPFLILATLEQEAALRHIPVIAMVDEQLADDLLPTVHTADFAGVVTKPVEQQPFVDLLQRLLDTN